MKPHWNIFLRFVIERRTSGAILRGMAINRLPRPRDPLQLGKLIVDTATGQVGDAVDDGKDAGASALGRRGGLKGGKARAKKLTAGSTL